VIQLSPSCQQHEQNIPDKLIVWNGRAAATSELDKVTLSPREFVCGCGRTSDLVTVAEI
jgi:hypothetical protein